MERSPRLARLDPPLGAVMVIAAHPGDVERHCAGTLALAADRGADVRLLLVSSGDTQSDDPAEAPATVAARREEAVMEAASTLGVADVAFLRHADGTVEPTHELRRELVAWIRHWRPATLLTHDPTHRPHLAHRDGRVVGRAALDAATLAVLPRAMPDLLATGLTPHRVAAAWLFGTTVPTGVVDIGAALDRRREAARIVLAEVPGVSIESLGRGLAALGRTLDIAAAEAFAVVPGE